MDPCHAQPPVIADAACFPRERGDGPRALSTELTYEAPDVSPASAGMDPCPPSDQPFAPDLLFPPRARGWTVVQGLAAVDPRVSPASAGMDPCRPAPSGQRASFPRERGDGPLGKDDPDIGIRFPPRARGWTQRSLTGCTGTGVSPASAGMDRASHDFPFTFTRFPRERGDGPVRIRGCSPICPFPPRARGWTPGAGRAGRCRTVSPASAGMDPRGLPAGRVPVRFPRERGDGPSKTDQLGTGHVFPPRARGWTHDLVVLGDGRNVSPASAGMDRPSLEESCCPPLTFPPRARGWTAVYRVLDTVHMVSPASAGMDLQSPHGSEPRRSFPRERGDGPTCPAGSRATPPFPPRARGWTWGHVRRLLWDGVSPASAGMDRCLAPLCGCR